MKRILLSFLLLQCPLLVVAGGQPLLVNEAVDVSADFSDMANTFFLADRLAAFDPATHTGKIGWQRAQFSPGQAFNTMFSELKNVPGNEFPANEYEANPTLPFAIEFVSPRTVRIRVASSPRLSQTTQSLMLAGPVPKDDSWKYTKVENGHRYTSAAGSITLDTRRWQIEFRDAAGKLLTRTDHRDQHNTSITPTLPFSFVRRASDYSRSLNAVFTLAPDEMIFGGGESFTEFNKRGQKLVLWADDARGVEGGKEYKPVPFFMSSRGYGMFMHTTTPITCDFGRQFSGHNELMIGDDELDLFIFLGSPKEILDEYTKLTGKSPMPPLWSFGLWMSRCTYSSEAQVRDVASKLRSNRIPCDVLHLDTGWFETDWRCDYEFSTTRFNDPQKMIGDLKHDGFHISLWQLPYFVPKNRLFTELLDKNLVVRDAKGGLPGEDAILDFSNPATVAWYQEKLAHLLKMGVGAVKADFGEAAPANGLYASGRTGFYEHNLYPLRYNQAVAEITKKTTGENIIWGRSAWAGSQRYPLHWGGDAENTDAGIAGELRGGLSFGLSGFSFWSHDVGGFPARAPADLYKRWLAMGVFSSHTRCHGTSPKEPWTYGDAFMDDFRRIDELKYELMPYVYAQAKDSSERGLPMLRALFVEFPEDAGAWRVDDEYMYGSSILVAPLMHENTTARDVYLPSGTWIDYQSGKPYVGGWQHIEAGAIPAVFLVREGAVIPHIKLAQSTSQMDWSNLELVVFAKSTANAKGLVCLPSDNHLAEVSLTRFGDTFRLADDPFKGKVTWKVTGKCECD